MAYIEREKVLEIAKDEYYSDFHKSMADLTSLKELLEDTPTADVVEVRHEKWLDYSDKYDRGMDLRCSVCGMKASAFVGGTEDWWDSWKPNYCPHCGAKMHREGKDEE